ncbi:cysteine protease [Friedmanniomyces endolithicus]|nr:cysteine protease [Friedmanniomyces endolithicus]
MSRNGKYIVRLNFNGWFRKVVIDDRLPVSSSGRVIHVVDRHNPGLLWPALIEKAYLKVLGGYDFPGSNSATDLWVLTGWIPEQVFLQSDDLEPERFWKQILDAFDLGDVLITMGTGKMTAETERDLGLAGEHDYAVLDLREVEGQRLLLIKNPWCEGASWCGKTKSSPGAASSERGLSELHSIESNVDSAPVECSRDRLNADEQLPPGTFWMDIDNVLQHFESIYLNWNPGIFACRQDIHFAWNLGNQYDGRQQHRGQFASLSRHPQLTVTASNGGTIWMLLSRHLRNATLTGATELEIPGSRHTIDLQGHIALAAFSSQGQRVLLPEKHIQKGWFVDSPQTLIKLRDCAPGSVYTIVPLEQDLAAVEHTFTLSIYGNSPLVLDEAAPRAPCTCSLSAAWTKETAGGNAHSPNYPSNPQFSVAVLQKLSICLMVEAASEDASVHVKLVYSKGRRVQEIQNRDIILDSGEYRKGCCVADFTQLDPGQYTIICSTFEPNQVGAFTLTVDSSQPVRVAALPKEGAGRLRMELSTATFGVGQGKIAVQLVPKRLVNFYAIASQLDGSSTRASANSSLLRVSIESGRGPMRRIYTASNGGEYADCIGGVRTGGMDLAPGMSRHGMPSAEDERAEVVDPAVNSPSSHDGWTNSIPSSPDDDSLDGFSETLEALEEYERDPDEWGASPDDLVNEPTDLESPWIFNADGEEDGDFSEIPFSFDPEPTPPPTYANGDLAGDLAEGDDWESASASTPAPHSVDADPYDVDGSQSGGEVSDGSEEFDDLGLDDDDLMDDDQIDAADITRGSSRSTEDDGSNSATPVLTENSEQIEQASNISRDALSSALAQAAVAQKEARSHWSTRNDLGFRRDDPRPQDLTSTRHDDGLSVQDTPTSGSYLHPQGTSAIMPEPDAVDSDIKGREAVQKGGRGGGRVGRGGGRPRGGIAWALKGTSHDPALRRKEARAEMLRDRPRGRGERSRGRPRGRPVVDPGMQFKAYQAEAMSAFMDGDLETAMSKAQLAVQANPEVGIAHSLLSEILRQMGREKESISALLTGAVLDRNPDLFIKAAERTLQVAEDSAWSEAASQAMWCYSSAYNHAPRDSETSIIARTGIRDVSNMMGDVHQARMYSKSLIRLTPTDFDNTRMYAQLCAATKDPSEIAKAKIAYENAFETTSAEQRNLGNLEHAWSHVNIYLELLDKLRFAAEGVRVAKRLARWVLGRKDENFWDRYADDDREFDSTHDRRALVGEFQQGRLSRDKAFYGDGLPVEIRVKIAGFRIKMGSAHHEEAMKHLDHVLAIEHGPEDYPDLFYNIANSLRTSGLHEGALKFYLALEPSMAEPSESFSLGLADCYESLHRQGDAERVYRALIARDPSNVQGRLKLARLYEQTDCKNQALIILKEVMALGRRDAIRQAKLPVPPSSRRPGRKRVEKPVRPRLDKPAKVKEAILSKRLSSSVLPVLAPSPAELTVARSAVSPREQREEDVNETSQTVGGNSEMLSTCNRLNELWHVVDGEADATAVAEWMHLVTTALHEFRDERAFFAKERFTGYGKQSSRHLAGDAKMAKAKQHAFVTLNRLEPGVHHPNPVMAAEVPTSSLPTTYYTISFHDWHRILVTLALQYAAKADQTHCYDLLREVLPKANIYNPHPSYSRTLLAASLHCALHFNDSAYALDLARDCAQKADFLATTPYQLLAAAARLCHGAANEFYTHATKAFMARTVKLMDFTAMPASLRNRLDFGLQTPSLHSRLAKLNHETAAALGSSSSSSAAASVAAAAIPDAGVLTIYGNTMAISSHFTSALPYYFRALALEPDNWSINLCIALTYIHQAMKRQTENRHYGIQQGLGFLQRYYDLRVTPTPGGTGPKAGHIQEAEYNRARTWHLLGLTHLAIPGYEEVLAMSAGVLAEGEREGRSEGEVEDFATEAAFALQGIFAVGGDEEAARGVGEMWLVI